MLHPAFSSGLSVTAETVLTPSDECQSQAAKRQDSGGFGDLDAPKAAS